MIAPTITASPGSSTSSCAALSESVRLPFREGGDDGNNKLVDDFCERGTKGSRVDGADVLGMRV